MRFQSHALDENEVQAMSDGRKNPQTDRLQLALGKSMSRRGMLQGAAALLGTAAVSGPLVTAGAQGAPTKEGVSRSKLSHKAAVMASDETAIEETATGKVGGYIRNGIYTYKGIPYGET